MIALLSRSVDWSVCLSVKKMSKLSKRLEQRDINIELETKDVWGTHNIIFINFCLYVGLFMHILYHTHTRSFMFDFSPSSFYIYYKKLNK